MKRLVMFALLCFCILLSNLFSADTKPVITEFPSSDHPTIPTGLKVSCSPGPNTLKESSTCPVIAWNEYVYWAFSYHDNREGMCIVAFTEDGQLVKKWDKTGARYVNKIISDEKAKTITFWGQSNRKITMKWSDLYLMIPPVEGRIPTKVHPEIPKGCKVDCDDGPGDEAKPCDMCPILEWYGLTYWAFSYIDNRVGMNIVAYDKEGKAVKNWEKKGARYIWDIELDIPNEKVSFIGQANKKITLTWKDLLVK